MALQPPAPLSDSHDIGKFDSGQPSLNEWLKRRARANQASGASRTFVVCDGNTVVGYYALASSSVACTDATGKFRRNMPDPIPVVVLARLAIDRRYQKQGIGRGLVRDAAKRVLAAADVIGIRGLVVHAINEEAKSFYSGMGFYQSPTSELTLMISVAELRENL